MTDFTPLIALIAETDDWLVINKPAGIGMHTENDQTGLVVLASTQFNRPLWPVHRLDKVTSGLLLLAKNADAAAELGQMFQKHHIQKFYLAQSTSKPVKKQGWIKGDMAKARNGSWKLTRSMDNPAITRFLSHYDTQQHQQRLFLLAPKTGKTHQLRVALKSIGSPITGDERYKGAASDRTYLHAASLVFDWKEQHYALCAAPESGNHWGAWPTDWLACPWQHLNV